MQILPAHVWLHILLLHPPTSSQSFPISSKQRFEHISTHLGPCQLILTRFGPVSQPVKGAPWLRGLPRIPQWGALLLHANSFHPSIHLSSLLSLPPPSISQCVVIFVCPPLFLPLSRRLYCLSVACFPYPSPFMLLYFPSQFETSSRLVMSANHRISQYIVKAPLHQNPCTVSTSNLQHHQTAHFKWHSPYR